jgi:hypothetical protein
MSNNAGAHVHSPRPRPISRRGWWILAGTLIGVIALYALVIHSYDAEGGSSTVGGLGATSEPGIIVTLEPITVNALTDQATLDLSFQPQGGDLVDSSGHLLENTRITINGQSGTQEAKFLAGNTLGMFEVTVGLDGEQVNYPFDVHSGFVSISADTYSKASDGSTVTTGDLNVGMQAAGQVSGWDTTMELGEGMIQDQFATVTFNRSFSTQIFAFVLLALVVALSVFALIVAVMAFTNRRRAEVGLLSWTAALLFALPLLRNYFPYGPPVGASIDIYVYLWVIVMAVVAATLIVVAWLNQNGAALRAERARHDALDDEGVNRGA